MSNLPAIRLPQYALEQVSANTAIIRSFVRVNSLSLIEACKRRGLTVEHAAICAGVLASVIEDLVVIGRLQRNDFERTKRKQRVLAAACEPIVSALRCAVAASPVNGRAAIEHWDVVCEKHEIGKLAWLLGMQTEASHKYSKKAEKRG